MRMSAKVGVALMAVAALGTISMSSAANAATGSVRFNVLKAGFIVGGSGGNGVLIFHGRRYPISIGGLSYGFTFGASQTAFRGTVSNIRRPSDVAGVYAAAGAGAALGPAGARMMVLTNQNGAVLRIAGPQVGAIVSADLNGMAISMPTARVAQARAQ